MKAFGGVIDPFLSVAGGGGMERTAHNLDVQAAIGITF
jgi:hypothetical protein